MASAVLSSHPRNSTAFSSMKKSRHASNGYAADPMAPERSFTSETLADSSNVRSSRPSAASTAPCVAQNFTTSAEPLSETASEDSFSLKRKSSCLDDGKVKENFSSAFGISLSLLSRIEKRRLRKRIKVDLQHLRSISMKLETREREIRSIQHSSRSTNEGTTINGRYVPAPAESRQSRQPSSAVRVSQVESNVSLEKCKRTPKANNVCTDSDFGMTKGKVPPEKPKSGNNLSARKAGSLSMESSQVPSNKFASSNGKKLLAEVLKQCGLILKRLMSHKFGWVFNEPVDVVKLKLHDYLTIIKKPMDLGTIKSRLDAGYYKLPNEFCDDVRLTFANAMRYNPKGHEVYFMADTLRSLFEGKWKVLEERLNYLNEERLDDQQEFRAKDPSQVKMKERSQEQRVKDIPRERPMSDRNPDRSINNSRIQDRVMNENNRHQDRVMNDNNSRNQDSMMNDNSQDRKMSDRNQDRKMADRIQDRKVKERMMTDKIMSDQKKDRMMTDQCQDRISHRSQDRSADIHHEKVRDSRQERVNELRQENTVGARDHGDVHMNPSHPTVAVTPAPSKKTKPSPMSRSITKPVANTVASQKKRDMTYEEKQYLSDRLGELPPDKLEQVINIMKRNPSLMQNDDEIEVDIESFDPETLWELHHFVMECNQNNKQEKRQHNVPKSPQMSNDAPKQAPSVQQDECHGEEDVDIGDDSPVKEFPPVIIEKDKHTGQKGGTSSSSSSGSGSSSSDSESGSSSGSDSEADDAA